MNYGWRALHHLMETPKATKQKAPIPKTQDSLDASSTARQLPRCRSISRNHGSKSQKQNKIYLQEVHPLECPLLRTFGNLLGGKEGKAWDGWAVGTSYPSSRLIQLNPVGKVFSWVYELHRENKETEQPILSGNFLRIRHMKFNFAPSWFLNSTVGL